MKRVEGTAGVKLLECVNPVKNTWRIRWDVREREDGSADYMEENFLGKPSGEIIRSVILGWYNEQIDREILSGFVYEGMPVWLSSENQFNYKAVSYTHLCSFNSFHVNTYLVRPFPKVSVLMVVSKGKPSGISLSLIHI